MDKFIEDLLAQTGAQARADPEVEAELRAELAERCANLINKRLIEALSDTQTEQLNTMLDNNPNDPEAFQQFITDSLPNQDEIVAATLYEFRALYLGSEA